MTDLVYVAAEPVHPTVNGGRVRMAGVLDALSAHLAVEVVELPGSRRLSPLATLRPRPRRGLSTMDAGAVAAAVDRHRPRAVVYSHSYLEPVGPTLTVPVVVDFPNLEVERQRTFVAEGSLAHRLSAAAEAWKARRWEPATARRAAVAIAVTDDDAATLGRWGARSVVVVPNAAAGAPAGPSPAEGPVLYLANAAYEPNAVAGHRLVTEVWPLVRARVPSARLRIAGRATADRFAASDGVDGIEVVGEVDDVADAFAGAALVVAPVAAGGGTQLKVVEALAHGRVVVATPYSAASVPPGAEAGCVTADGADAFATEVAALLADVGSRHRREGALRDGGAVPTWRDAARPLLDALATLR